MNPRRTILAISWRRAVLLVVLAPVLLCGAAALAQPAEDDAFDELFGEETIEDEDLFEESVADDLFAEDTEEQTDAEEAAPESTLEPADASPTGPAQAVAPDAAPTEDDSLEEALRPVAPGPTQGVEEILVQGQAAAGIEADATVSVTSFDAEDLQALGISDVSDVAKYTPNLEIVAGSVTAPTFFIRGVGLNDFTANAQGAIAIYQDDVALSLPAIQLGQLFDVEALEVLRGPQGHGPNRNASGGAIKIYSRKPTGELGGKLDVTYGRFNQREFEGALEVPLRADTLSARVAVIVSQRDPLMDNRCAGAPPLVLTPVDPDSELPLASLNRERITSFGRNGAPSLRQPIICNSPLRRSVQNDLGLGGPDQLRISDLRPGLSADLDDKDRWAARGQLRFVPEVADLDMDWVLNLHGGRIDQFARVGQSIGTVATGGKRFGGRTTNGYRAPEIVKEEQDILAKVNSGQFTRKPGETALGAAQRILAKRLARRLDRKPFEGDFNRTGRERQSTYGATLRGDFELDWAHLTSVTGFERYDRFRNLDADYTSDVVFEFRIKDRAWQFSEDIRVEGELERHPVRWNAGVYYLMDQLDYDNDTVVAPPSPDLRQIYDQKTWSLGVYAGLEWDLLDDFTLEGGVRFNWERKSFDIQIERAGLPICGLPLGLGAEPVPCTDTQTWQDPSGVVKLSYRLTEELVAYGSFSRGFKPGQYSVGGATGDAFTLADPETVDSFEAGLKGSVLDGRLDIAAAVFHYAYENYQVFLAANDAFTPPQRVVVNADDALLYGAELELTAVPLQDLGHELLDGLRLESRLSWIESEFLDFTQTIFRRLENSVGDPVLPVEIDWTGNRLPNTPRLKWSGTVEYTLDMGRYGSLIPRWDFVWTDDNFFDASDGRGIPDINGQPVLPEFAIGQRAYWLHNLRLTWRSAGSRLELAFWVRNVNNKVYKTLAYDASEGANLVGNQVGDPRTYGVTLSLDF